MHSKKISQFSTSSSILRPSWSFRLKQLKYFSQFSHEDIANPVGFFLNSQHTILQLFEVSRKNQGVY